MNEEQQRIRGYLTSQAAKLPPSEIIEKVRAAMAEVRAAAAAVPDARFIERPAAEEWSGNEVMAHVVTTGARFCERITRILDGNTAGSAVADVIEKGVPSRRAEEWWEQLSRDRDALFARVLGADPATNLAHTIEHRFFGPLNWREALLFLRLHDLDHAGQLRKIAEALA